MTTHELKIWPEFYREVKLGFKTFEVRENDRNFLSGDKVILKEWSPEKKDYTGESLRFKIGYVFKIYMSNTVVFSLLKESKCKQP